MKRPLRYRTMGAVREGRGNPSPYSIQEIFNCRYDTNILDKRCVVISIGNRENALVSSSDLSEF